MQIAETLNQGLRREFSCVIPAADIAKRVDVRLAEVSKQIRMPGFRPGKVPANLVRKMHGPALHGEAVQAAVSDGVQQLLGEKALRPAVQPQVDLEGDLVDGQDLSFKVALEILPTIESVNIDDLALEKLVVQSDEAAIAEMLARLATQQQKTEPAAAKYKAKTGDTVVIDFEGSVDGELFEGGKGEGMRVTIGSGMLIPGFEDQLVGTKANQELTIDVKFPEDYGSEALAGKPAQFKIMVQGVETPVETPIDDEFAKGLGIDSLDALKDILKDQIEAETSQLTRTHMKRKLLDTLAARHDFEVPETMVEGEFEQIWAQLEQEASRAEDPEAAKAEIEAERADYRRIAERRVRLGLLLSEIGNRGGITVSNAEMNRLIGQEATRYAPAEQQKVVKFFQENAMAAAQLRAPLYEDKVVDYLVGKAEVTERAVSRADLEAAIEDEDGSPAAGGHVHGPDCDHDHDHAPAKPAKKAKAKPAKAAEEPGAEEIPVEAPPAEEAPAIKEPEKKAPPKKAAARKA
ncbi:trigger factor [Polymorphobacter multimanifer]|uniref:trigger factor n=1 Tax=Polymorphobacter multimanifer TaxID=1070431 RepID=UPI0016663DA4|nr:trigger factor [Polymorphobacter multimanifer]GGI84521.1 trigger factor [Polymorphobacter multimanifer]